MDKFININDELRDKLIIKGASIVGYADLFEIPEHIRKGFNYGVIIAVALNSEKVIKIFPGPNMEYYHEYNKVNILLNDLAEFASAYLINKGFKALPNTKATVKYDKEKRRTELPHKTIATRAGIGWIGKCALLINEKYGAAIRLTSVLTNAKLDVGNPINESRCYDCLLCKDICPANAISGKNWVLNMDRDDFFNFLLCKDKIIERGLNLGLKEGMCGLCIWSCPWTQKYIKNNKDEKY